MTLRDPTPQTKHARCHCGAVEIKAWLPQGTASAKRCDCSICRRRGPGAVTATTDSVTVLSGADHLTHYTWHTHMARHWFCKICGCYVYHQRRSDPAECGINIGCLDGINPRDFADIPWTDGVNHASDP